MLTFFKPWHSEHNLRSDKNILWHDAFHAYPFTTHQQQIMDNFMIKYECNDARDDFCAQRKRLEKGIKLPQTYSEKDLDEMDTRYYIDDGVEVGDSTLWISISRSLHFNKRFTSFTTLTIILRFFPHLFPSFRAVHFTYPAGIEPAASLLPLQCAYPAGAVDHCTKPFIFRLPIFSLF